MQLAAGVHDTVNGAYTFSVRASGPGGTDATPATRSFTVDTAAPETTITGGPTPSFTFTSSEANSTFACKLDTPSDAGSYASCTSPKAYTTTALGTYTFSVRATDAAGNIDATPATQSFTVVTPPTPTPSPSPSPSPAGCAATNGADVQISDFATVESPITVSGCAGNASATATVEVHIVHTYIGDLVVTLVAPDGSTYLLHNRAGGSTDNINQTYTVNLSSEPANGTWKLRVQDAASADVGRIDSWTINPGLGPTPTPTPTAAAPDTSITGGPSGVTNGTAPSFSFSATLAGSTFECRLDTPGGAAATRHARRRGRT